MDGYYNLLRQSNYYHLNNYMDLDNGIFTGRSYVNYLHDCQVFVLVTDVMWLLY